MGKSSVTTLKYFIIHFREAGRDGCCLLKCKIALDAQVLVKLSGVVQSSEDSTTMIPATGLTDTSSGN